MDHGDCPVVSSKPSDPQQRRPDGRMYFVETAEQLRSVSDDRAQYYHLHARVGAKLLNVGWSLLRGYCPAG